MTIDPRILDLANQHLTEGQHAVWASVTLAGNSFRGTAVTLDLPRTTVTDRYDAACRTLRKHGVRFTPDGRPYLEEQTTA